MTQGKKCNLQTGENMSAVSPASSSIGVVGQADARVLADGCSEPLGFGQGVEAGSPRSDVLGLKAPP